jgi:hypothetical protein
MRLYPRRGSELMLRKEDLEDIAYQFSQQDLAREHLHAFSCDSWVDPLALWSLEEMIKPPIKWILFLTDWMPKGQAAQSARTVAENCDYCEDYFWQPWDMPAEDQGDVTLINLFWAGWSRLLFKSEHCLAANTVLGVRNTIKTTNPRTGNEETTGVDLPASLIEQAIRINCQRLMRAAEPEAEIFFVCQLGKLQTAFQTVFPGDRRIRYLCHPSYRTWHIERAGLRAAGLEP